MNIKVAKRVIKNGQNIDATYWFAKGYVDALQGGEVYHLIETLTSISDNRCCDKCQEAAKWADKALIEFKKVITK